MIVKVEAQTSCVLRCILDDGSETDMPFAPGDSFTMGDTPIQIDVRCQECGHRWPAHHEYMEVEDDSYNMDVPCRIEGCDCPVFMEFTPIRGWSPS